MTARPVFWLHAGTHKTGTTALQELFAEHREELLRNGICYPRAGDGGYPEGTLRAGHANFVRDAAGDDRFRPDLGSIDDAIAEAWSSGCAQVFVSSEELHLLYTRPALLERLCERLRDAGFVPRVLLYLRSQAGYLESLFAQIIRIGVVPPPFAALVRATVSDGGIVHRGKRNGILVKFAFDYGELIATFAKVFGTEQVTIRAYRENAPVGALAGEVLSLLGVRTAPSAMENASRHVNARPSIRELASLLLANAERRFPVAGSDDARRHADAMGDVACELLRTRDLLLLMRRFRRSDSAISREWDVPLVPVTWSRLRSALATDLGIHRRARAARHTFESLERMVAEAADASGDSELVYRVVSQT